MRSSRIVATVVTGGDDYYDATLPGFFDGLAERVKFVAFVDGAAKKRSSALSNSSVSSFSDTRCVISLIRQRYACELTGLGWLCAWYLCSPRTNSMDSRSSARGC